MASISEWIRDFNRLKKWEKVSIIVGILGLLAGILFSGNHLLKINSDSNQINITNSSVINSPMIQDSSNISVMYNNNISAGANLTYNATTGVIDDNRSIFQTVNFEKFTGDGATANFSLTYPLITNSSRVYLNGLRQIFGSSYIEHSQSINFTGVIPNGYIIEVEYVQS